MSMADSDCIVTNAADKKIMLNRIVMQYAFNAVRILCIVDIYEWPATLTRCCQAAEPAVTPCRGISPQIVR
jgi:hypothetical protein